MTNIQNEFTNPIRVCMISFYFYPEYSGSMIQALNLSRYLKKIGVDPFIVTANLSGAKRKEVFRGINVFRIAVINIKNLKVFSFWVTLCWFLIKKRKEYDIIHVHGAFQHGPASLMGRFLKKKTILKVTMANSDIAFYRQGRLWGRLNRFFANRFDHYIATSKKIFDEFSEVGLNIRKVSMIPNGVDTDVNKPIYKEVEKNNLKQRLKLPLLPLVVYSGIINQRKNIDFILEIWREVISKNTNAHLILVGPFLEKDLYYKKLLNYIEINDLTKHVSFLGYQESVTPYLQASNVFLFPSKQEGMPNVLLEAMACGLPCIATMGSGMEDIIKHQINGLIFSLDNKKKFAESISNLFQNQTACDKIGKEARKYITMNVSLEKISEIYKNLYLDLLRN